MKILSRDRQQGKTSLLLQMVRSDPKGYLLVSSNQQVQKLRQQNPDIKDKILPYYSVDYLANSANIYLDDLEAVLLRAVNHRKIEVATTSSPVIA